MTVTFPQLGNYGRLGNQLFQIAATCAHAWNHDTEPIFPLWERSYAFGVPEHYFRRFVPHPAGDPYDPGWNYAELPYWDDMALHGYFQSPRYWKGHDGRVRMMLRPKLRSPFRDEADGLCCVHVRRGDYEELRDHHPAPTPLWYAKAITTMMDRGAQRFIVCSDDPRWCKEQPEFKECEVSDKTELHDLAMMACAPFHIISNSTFSWWGAYLSESKDVIMPARWFGPALPDLNAGQLVCDGWTVMGEP